MQAKYFTCKLIWAVCYYLLKMNLSKFLSAMSSVKKRTISAIGFVLLVAVVYIFISYRQGNVLSPSLPGAIPTPIPYVGKIYSDPQNQYTIQVPQGWSEAQDINPDTNTTVFMFNQNNQQYAFQILPYGASPQAYASKMDEIESNVIYIDGRQFLRSLWIYQDKPFFISVSPNEENLAIPTFQMRLPQDNTQQYINLFDQTVSHMSLSPQLKSIPSPRVTIQAPGVVNFSPEQ